MDKKTMRVPGFQVVKHPMPAVRTRIVTENDFREELPFQHQFESLAYIGIQTLKTWRINRHVHEHFELCYVDEGQGWFAVDGYLYAVKAGDLFLTKPNENHEGAASGDSPYRLYYIGFQLMDLPKLESDYYRIGSERVVHDRLGVTKKLFDDIFAEIAEPKLHGALMAQHLFSQLLIHVLRLYRAAWHENISMGEIMTAEIKDLLDSLHEQVHIGWNAGDLARKYHISRTHLEREFKRILGIPLGRYIRSLCLQRAKYLLWETDHSITSIAEQLGFSSIHAFSVFFKRHVSRAPQAYRTFSSAIIRHDEKR